MLSAGVLSNTDLLKFLDASVSFYLGHGSIAGTSYGSDEAGAQATAQSERTKSVLVANRGPDKKTHSRPEISGDPYYSTARTAVFGRTEQPSASRRRTRREETGSVRNLPIAAVSDEIE